MKLQHVMCFAGLTLCLAPGARAFDRNDHDDGPNNIVYINANNPLPGKNAVLAYKRNPGTGDLTELPGSPFYTGGAGYYNIDERLGPDDHDQEVIASPDGRFLYAVNQGSGSIAGFAIQHDGSLRAVPGSPFSSGGLQPSSLAIDIAALFVANRGDQNPGGTGGSHVPNYTGFLILPNGSLLQLPWSKLPLTPGSSPTQVELSPNGRLVFDSHVFEVPVSIPGLPPFLPQYASQLHSYRVDLIGQLIPLSQAGTPPGPPPYILGVRTHPTKKILYAGFVVAGALAAYSYDDAGHMTFVSATPGGGAGPCWIALTPDAKFAYTADAITDQIDVFSLADPLHPVLVQTVDLKGPKVPLNDPLAPAVFSTAPFQIQVSPDGKFLYVVNHETTLDNSQPSGNQIHWLKIANNGKLTEANNSPLVLPLSEEPANGHPLGVLVF